MAIIGRILIFISLLVSGLAFGWEFMLAGVIFLLSVNPDLSELIFLGAFFDALFLFPLGFFTVSIAILAVASNFLAGYFAPKGFLSISFRMVLLLLLAILTLGLFLINDFSHTPFLILKILYGFILKAAAVWILATALFKLFLTPYGQKIFLRQRA